MRRYFDNAATSYPKPPEVTAAVLDYLERVHASAGRGAYREALESRRMLDDCRTALRTLFHARPTDQVIFALNGTDALHLALRGIVRPGDHVVTTCMDHNSVLRPLSALETQLGVRWTAVAVDPDTTRLDPARLASALRDDTRSPSSITPATSPAYCSPSKTSRPCVGRGGCCCWWMPPSRLGTCRSISNASGWISWPAPDTRACSARSGRACC
jgi:hypothetical protein